MMSSTKFWSWIRQKLGRRSRLRISHRRLDLVVHWLVPVHYRISNLTADIVGAGRGDLIGLHSGHWRVAGSTRHLRNVVGRQRRDPSGDRGADWLVGLPWERPGQQWKGMDLPQRGRAAAKAMGKLIALCEA